MATMTKTAATQLARHLLTLCFAGVPVVPRPNLPVVTEFVQRRLADDSIPLEESDLEVLEALADEPDITTVGDRRRRVLLRAFGLPELVRLHAAAPVDDRRPEPLRPQGQVLRAAVRVAVDPENASPDDTQTLDTWVHTKGSTAVATMDDYVAERRGLPDSFDVSAFVAAVKARLTDLGGTVSAPFVAVVAGRLMLDGNIDPVRTDFRWAVKRAYDTGVSESPRTPGVPNKKHYEEIVGDFKFLRKGQRIKYQELAAVADHVITSADEDWDILDDSSRRAQVEVGMIRYADGTVDTGFATLDLPPIVSEDASNQEIEPSNVQAVAMIAAAYEIEQTGAFDVVDQMVELFTQGMLPVRDDSGGRALNRYYWQAEDRLDASGRATQYARALGRGDTGHGDAQPNTQFDTNVMRFVSALVRYDENLQVSTVVTSDRRDRLATSEGVRKCAQDLAANASLYGWGFTVFAARKLSRHIDQVFDVLGEETLQRAYGVTGPWQLVERVSAVELGSTPAIIQHRTRAQSIKYILDTLAVYSTELSRSGGVRRFLPNLDDFRSSGAAASSTNGSTASSSGFTGTGSTVSIDDYERLVAAANNILAVGGVTDDEISRYSTPVASPARGSIPTVGLDGLTDTANLDQIRQLAQQGQFDQLQRLLGAGSSALG